MPTTALVFRQQEAIDNLGTIAKSGTKDFVSKLSGDQKADSQLIGQFGVGFYSGFIVADKITVESRRAGLPTADGVRWVSGGSGDFEVESIERAQRGTSVTLHLRDDALDYASNWKLKGIIAKYSDHISLPILMEKEEWKEGEAIDKDDPSKGTTGGGMVMTGEWETVNQASALWTRAKKDITPEQYQDFYKQISHDHADALAHTHNRVEGNQEYTQLLYIPSKAPMDLYNRERNSGLKLYVKRVFIMDDAEALLAGLPALCQRRGRFQRPAAERQPRAAAGKPRRQSHPRRLHQARAGHAGRFGQTQRFASQGLTRYGGRCADELKKKPSKKPDWANLTRSTPNLARCSRKVWAKTSPTKTAWPS